MDHANPETVTILVRMLVDALRGRGLSAEAFGAAMVWAANRAADPPHGDASARISPGLRQAVLCRPDGDGELTWWWVWTGPDGSPEHELICPAVEITAAADAVTRVLALRPVGAPSVR